MQQSLNIVSQQPYPNRECLIIDGGSKDGTVDLLAAIREQISSWVSEPDKGIYNAWNRGLSRAKGEWICFLGAEDYFCDDQVLGQIVAQLVMIPPDIRVAYDGLTLREGAASFLCATTP